MIQLPSFLVIGASRSGTTSLHEYLRQHPSISLPKRKETHFFVCDRDSDFPMVEYDGKILKYYIDNLHDYLEEFEYKEGLKIFGEVCPSYLFYPNAAQNVKRYIPDAKLICILRNPADRLYSSYIHANRNNTFETFVNLVDKLPLVELEHPDFNRMIKGGLYFEMLMRYYSEFPNKNIKIYLFEDLVTNPLVLMNNFMDFIEIPEFKFHIANKFNISGTIRWNWARKIKIRRTVFVSFLRKVLPIRVYQQVRSSGEKIFFKKPANVPLATRIKIQEYYKFEILRLQELIQRDLSHWFES